MFTAYGSAHRRLRRLVAPAFAARRLAALTPAVERHTAALLDELDGTAERVVDLRAAYAVQLPVRVISDLIGVPHDMRSRFKETIDRIWNTTLTSQEAMAATTDVYEMLAELIAIKRAEPADDMTSALIAAHDEENGETSLTERELIDTLLLVIAAGYETTVNLIDSAITALLADPGPGRDNDSPGRSHPAVLRRGQQPSEASGTLRRPVRRDTARQVTHRLRSRRSLLPWGTAGQGRGSHRPCGALRPLPRAAARRPRRRPGTRAQHPGQRACRASGSPPAGANALNNGSRWFILAMRRSQARRYSLR
jgi:hypothetical protein